MKLNVNYFYLIIFKSKIQFSLYKNKKIRECLIKKLMKEETMLVSS
jgi:hypothetical protein